MTDQPEIPTTSADDVKKAVVRSLALVATVDRSPLTDLIAELCELLVQQRMDIIRLQALLEDKTPEVAQGLMDAFNEGVEGARERSR